MSNSNFSGTILLTSGHISSHRNIIEVCENEKPQDYKIITNLIKNIPTV